MNLYDLVDAIQKKHGIYCTVTIKPWYDGTIYIEPRYEIYISEMPVESSFKRGLSRQEAVSVLKELLDSVPQEIIEKRNRETVKLLTSQLRDITERLGNLGVDLSIVEV